MRRKLPIGIQTFRKIREGGFYYVDKTAFVKRLVDEGEHHFLSRPRRFGKSLLVDTMKELFEGNEALFRGLAIHDEWDWSVRHPVVRLDFSGDHHETREEVADSVATQLDEIESAAGVRPRYERAAARFRYLIRRLHEKSGRRVVVLVDEYDKPILDVLDDPAAARKNRDFLRGLYGTVKFADAHIRFSFFTGVSKFTRVSLFSDLNNLRDITLHRRYSSLCGYTEADLDAVFGPELAGLDREGIRDWYNGYCWRGRERVYNPFGLLLFFDEREFKPYWFRTATPAFLVEVLRKRGMFAPALDGMWGTDDLLSKFDVEDIGLEALLFQTGYLTIVGEEDPGDELQYRLGYPNREVRQSLNKHLLATMTPVKRSAPTPGGKLRKLLEAGDFGGIEALFRGLFAGIPYEWHTRNEIARYEGYYASVFYSHFAAAGLPVVVEDSGSRGRVDLSVRFRGRVSLFEFKMVEREPEGKALAQLRARDYAAKYRGLGEPIHLVGVEFSREKRNIAAFTVEPASA